ncbi:MAG TPA: hypothetical protein VFT12_01970 [Thermoanaerobaculia bacterium]|nr:hypothetical protein [Thermoanaerobaculia bacterium]
MWPRLCEALLAIWLLVSPAVLAGSSRAGVVARVAAVLMLAFSLLSLFRRLRRAYLGTLLIAVLISAYPFLHPAPASPMLQNLLIVGLVVAMFAIIPPEATLPPREWRELDHR